LLLPLAGTFINFNLTVANLGNAAVRQLNITIPGVEVFCEGQNMSSAVTQLAVNQHVACGGSFIYDQDVLEAGSRNFTAGGSAANLGGPGPASNTVEVVVAASPSLQLDVDALNCTKPARMRELLVLLFASDVLQCAVAWPLTKSCSSSIAPRTCASACAVLVHVHVLCLCLCMCLARWSFTGLSQPSEAPSG
jgi:hypothetical protein